MFAIARKALADLATTSLEERIGEVFTRRLREMPGPAKAGFAEALKTASDPALVRSAFELACETSAARDTKNALNETFTWMSASRFETAADLAGGIELATNGQKMGWTIADYLASEEKAVGDLLKGILEAPVELKPGVEEAVPEAKAESRSEAKTEPKVQEPEAQDTRAHEHGA